MPVCIESCFDNQRCELFEKGRTYEIQVSHPLICFFDCDAGKKARDAKRAKLAKRHGIAAARAAVAQSEGPAAAAELSESIADTEVDLT